MATSHPLPRTRLGGTNPTTNPPKLAPQQQHPPQVSGLGGGNGGGGSRRPSNISLFLANLRLLDLDLLPDWPGIQPQTFAAASAGAAAQGLKRRVQCVEWALYRLAEIWDPEDTHAKLQQYFPPTDQVQSLNLRAGLLRCLDQAKKNGVLGRDAVIRKTMLDECRGERLEEVLAAFSFAVLRKTVSEDAEAAGPTYTPAVAQNIALENRGYAEERTELTVLSLAYRASLARRLRQKADSRAVYRDFSDLLDLKERSAIRRREQLKAVQARRSESEITDEDRLETRRLVGYNWSGDERWMETLLYGDSNAKKDSLLSTPFDRVWRRVQQGRLSELEDKGGSLLEQLDGRVRFQRDRLEKWGHFRKEMFGDTSDCIDSRKTTDKPQTKKGIDFGFGAHRELCADAVTKASPGKVEVVLGDEYENLIASFEKELEEAGTVKGNPLEELTKRMRKVPERKKQAEIPVSKQCRPEEKQQEDEEEEEEEEEEGEQQQEEPVRRREMRKPSRGSGLSRMRSLSRPVPEAYRGRASVSFAAHSNPSHPHISQDELDPSEDALETKTRPRAIPPSTRRERAKTSPPPVRERTERNLNKYPTLEIETRPQTKPAEQPCNPPNPPSPIQAQADQILASMENPSPSPIKRTKHRPEPSLSLAERTRLSMAPRTAHPKHAPQSDSESEPNPKAASKPPVVPALQEDATKEQEDLVSRTRKSMAGFEAARKQAHLERRRSERKSRAAPPPPVPLWEDEAERKETSVLMEGLLETGDEDYEAVFRSRPRILNSPMPSPTRGN